MSVCVLGAGIIGLPTATEIQRLEPRAKVTVVAADFSPNLTSDMAAGFWRPIFLPDPREDLIRRWGDVTFNKMADLANENAVQYGATFASGYEFGNVDDLALEKVNWTETVRDFRIMTPKEKQNMGYGNFKNGYFYTTTFLESSTYLPYLLNQFKRNGGKVQRRRVTSLSDLSDYSCIVNCTGLGAYNLGDASCFPIRGQVYRVDAPFIQHWYNFHEPEHTCYILPNQHSVVVGGTHQDNDWNTKLDSNDGRVIWDAACKYVPSLKEAKILKQVAGLRPGRPSIRLEKEKMNVGGKMVTVVHNYGHSGSGVTLHQGCAEDAAQLVTECIHRAKL